MREEDYSTCPVCVCVCVSVFSILLCRGFRHPKRGISSYRTENAVKLIAIFSKTA